ncbi:hypothetical protein [Actinoallomurus oryzae]|uniref:hypothetical protein n=1 Tax=Actinoallomurus oryzae TaxID=502180 RepID=UPI0031E62047
MADGVGGGGLGDAQQGDLVGGRQRCLTAVAGPSGSGKSSLLAVAATLMSPDAGTGASASTSPAP